MLTRRTFCQAGAATLVATSAPGLAGKPARRPNFVVILADDLGYGDLGCFGSPNILTPRLDRLAEEGLKLTCVYAEPFCGPARASLMTGSYPIRVAEPGNVKHRHTVLHVAETTIADVLAAHGYRNAMIGKWGIGVQSNAKWRRDLQPLRQGFHHYFGTPGSNDTPADVVLLGGDGKVIEAPAKLDTLTERYADEAIRFIRENRDQPFFVYLCPNMPHVALAPSARFKGTSARGPFGDVVEEIDHHVGRIVDEIRGLGLENDTWVIFASDNGPWIVKEGDGGSPGPFRGGKSSIWEGGVRVPGIVWAPGRVAAGRTSHEMTALQDLLPTLASLAGAPLPPKVTLDGHDLSDLFLGRTAASPRKTFAYYLSAHLQAVRQGKWKLHLPRPADPEWLAPFTPSEHLAPEDAIAVTRPMLFDIESDYAERWNVADDHPQIVTELYGLVERFRADLGDYNRMGSGVRLFEPYDVRPARPVLVP